MRVGLLYCLQEAKVCEDKPEALVPHSGGVFLTGHSLEALCGDWRAKVIVDSLISLWTWRFHHRQGESSLREELALEYADSAIGRSLTRRDVDSHHTIGQSYRMSIISSMPSTVTGTMTHSC